MSIIADLVLEGSKPKEWNTLENMSFPPKELYAEKFGKPPFTPVHAGSISMYKPEVLEAAKSQKGAHLSTGVSSDKPKLGKDICDRILCPPIAAIVANEDLPDLKYDPQQDTLLASWNTLLTIFLRCGSPPNIGETIVRTNMLKFLNSDEYPKRKGDMSDTDFWNIWTDLDYKAVDLLDLRQSLNPTHTWVSGVRSNNGLGNDGKGRPCAERLESTFLATSVTEEGERRVYLKNNASVVANMKNDAALSTLSIRKNGWTDNGGPYAAIPMAFWLFGRRNKRGDFYLSEDDLKRIYLENKYPKGWKPFRGDPSGAVYTDDAFFPQIVLSQAKLELKKYALKGLFAMTVIVASLYVIWSNSTAGASPEL